MLKKCIFAMKIKVIFQKKNKKMSWTERTELLIKEEGLLGLKKAHVMIVGLGGVGSFAAEFIARSGVGKMTLVDGDVFDSTNKNRQLSALDSTLGQSKAQVTAMRIRDINPDIDLVVYDEFLSPDRAAEMVDENCDYIIDCIDSVTPKLSLILSAMRKKVKIISNMGAGGILDATRVKVSDIRKTRDCPLAKNIRKRLRKEGISSGFKAVYSTEMPLRDSVCHTDGKNFKKSYYGTISYMPASFGLLSASTVINYLLKKSQEVSVSK